MPALADPRHEKFVRELVKGNTQADAYLAAGYAARNASVASAAATRLLKRVEVTRRLAELQQDAGNKASLTKAWVLDRLMKHARVCLGEEKVSLTVKPKDLDTTVTVEVHARDAANANRALELLGKEIGMFVSRTEVGGPGEFERMSESELAEYVAKESRELLGIGLRVPAAKGRIAVPGGQGDVGEAGADSADDLVLIKPPTRRGKARKAAAGN